MTEVKVLADSIGEHGCRITTIQAKFPRIILSAFRTYASLSYSVRSSRAVPVKVMLDEVRTDPFVPRVWRRAVKGMVAGEELGPDEAGQCRLTWLDARDRAADRAEALLSVGVAKEHANRLIEPFAWAWAVVTGTDDAWAWLFKQRCHEAAQPEFQVLATLIRDAMGASTPELLPVEGWHVPYSQVGGGWPSSFDPLRVSAARCARVSYAPFDGDHGDPRRDAELADRLWADGHLSPFEHAALCCATRAHRGKLMGWMSYRTWKGY